MNINFLQGIFIKPLLLDYGFMPCTAAIVRFDCPRRAHCRVASRWE